MFPPKTAVTLNEGNELISEAVYEVDYFFQGLTLTMFGAHHIHLSQGA